jgi:ABC-type taurine transport system substrate-binding protein
MSGGHIKNAMMRAGIRAASQNGKISHDILWDAAVQEFRDMGHVIREGNEYSDQDIFI